MTNSWAAWPRPLTERISRPGPRAGADGGPGSNSFINSPRSSRSPRIRKSPCRSSWAALSSKRRAIPAASRLSTPWASISTADGLDSATFRMTSGHSRSALPTFSVPLKARRNPPGSSCSHSKLAVSERATALLANAFLPIHAPDAPDRQNRLLADGPPQDAQLYRRRRPKASSIRLPSTGRNNHRSYGSYRSHGSHP